MIVTRGTIKCEYPPKKILGELEFESVMITDERPTNNIGKNTLEKKSTVNNRLAYI